MEQQAQLIIEAWRMFLRRFWTMAIIGGVGVGIAAFIAYIMPPVYESEATILVESQQIPNALAQSTVTTGAAERLSLIRQRMMTRDNLQRVIEDLELFQNRSDLSVSQKIQALRAATELEPINLQENRSRSSGSVSAFVVRVRFPDSKKAAEIANEFVTKTLSQNLRARNERATDTLEFFRLEAERLSLSLIDIEDQLSTFKNRRENSLPTTLQSRRNEMERISQNTFNLEQDALVLEEERSGLIFQLQQLQRPTLTAGVSPEAQQLRGLEVQLAQKRAVFSESHRVVKRLKTEIAALTAAVEANDEANTGEDGEQAQTANQQIMGRRVQFIDTQIEVLNDQKVALANRRIALEESIAQTPDTETQLNALSRRQLELENQYSVIIRKRADAETGEKLEVNQQAERFEVIENALASDEPVSPNRPQILALGSGFAIVLAVGLALFLELMNPAMRSAAQMERKLELRPVATIPYIRTEREKNRTRVGFVALFILIAIALPLTLFAIDTYYHPIQLLAEKMLDRTGIGQLVRFASDRL